MIDDIIEIIEFYLDSLDREYDNDMVVLAEKILRELNITRNDIKTLLTAVPGDVELEVKDALRILLK